MKQAQLQELINAGILSEEKANEIVAHFSKPSGQSPILVIVFSILGALLLGLGIILIVAHNWDDLGKTTKTVLSFLPLLVGQIACGYYLFGKNKSVALREGASTFLIISVGACISLISQIYQIPGEMSEFLIVWIIMSLPLAYMMKSQMASLLSIVLITWYTTSISEADKMIGCLWFILFIASLIPRYLKEIKDNPNGNFLAIHHWFIPVSLLFGIRLFNLGDQFWRSGIYELILLSYICLLGVFYLIGNRSYFFELPVWKRGYTIIGSLGTVGILYFFSFPDFWNDLYQERFREVSIVDRAPFLTSVILAILGLSLYIYQKISRKIAYTRPLNIAFILFFLIFIIGIWTPKAAILVNLLILAIGLLTVKTGAEQNHFGILNYGLIILLILVLCRFFDESISFVMRGIMFMGVGILFFLANYRLIKQRQSNEN